MLGRMSLVVTIDADLAARIERVALERGVSAAVLVRETLEQIAASEQTPSEKERRRASTALEKTFQRFQFDIGPRTWTRDDLHERD